MTEEDQSKSLRTSVFLTPDDIITLRLLRDDIAKEVFDKRWQRSTISANQMLLETLERILKQVG